MLYIIYKNHINAVKVTVGQKNEVLSEKKCLEHENRTIRIFVSMFQCSRILKSAKMQNPLL